MFLVTDRFGSEEDRETSLKIGVYGGTFNPIHFGHLRTAEEIWYRFKLKNVIFVPSASPPHKDTDLIDPLHRLKMTTLAITGNEHFCVSDIELNRPGKSYTIETLRELKKRNPEAEFYFIMGRDAFLEIDSWYYWTELFAETNFIVTTRPGSNKIPFSKLIPEKARKQFKRVRAEAGNECEFVHSSGKRLVFTSVTDIDISSTLIRDKVRRGETIRYLTPRRVREYIIENGLYQS